MNTIESRKPTISDIEAFVALCKKARDGWLEELYASTPHKEVPYETIAYSVGKKYIRVTNNGSAHVFIDMANGDILKAASYSTPAKGARGNIFKTNKVDQHGKVIK